jgi:hypothetical protein
MLSWHRHRVLSVTEYPMPRDIPALSFLSISVKFDRSPKTVFRGPSHSSFQSNENSIKLLELSNIFSVTSDMIFNDIV